MFVSSIQSLKMLLLTVLLCCLGTVVAAPQKVYYDIDKAQTYFDDFVLKYNKEYKDEDEKQARFEIFKKNLVIINEENKNETAVLGITQFTDLTNEEYNAMYNTYPGDGYGYITPCTINPVSRNRTLKLPENFDWRILNVVTSVKNQMNCGSCWTFAATATIEGQYARKYGYAEELSNQQLLECGNHRKCDLSGYFITNGIKEAADFGGLMSYKSYPYVPHVGPCKADRNAIVAKVTGCIEFRIQQEDELRELLVTYGPLAIAVSATNWSIYDKGIYDCKEQTISHAVLLVGYGIEGNTPYWIIKNSYGTTFGENGYIRIRRNTNACNIVNGMKATATIQ